MCRCNCRCRCSCSYNSALALALAFVLQKPLKLSLIFVGRPGVCTIKHNRIVMYGFLSKLVCLYKPMKVTDSNINVGLFCNLPISANYESVMFSAGNTKGEVSLYHWSPD